MLWCYTIFKFRRAAQIQGVESAKHDVNIKLYMSKKANINLKVGIECDVYF